MTLDPRRVRDLERALAPLTTLTVYVGRHSDTIASNLATWLPGPQSSTGNGGRAPISDDGSNNGPVPRLASGHDPITMASRDLARHLEHAARSAEAAYLLARSLMAIDSDTAAMLADRAPVDRSASCVNCGTWVANTPQDRLRAGRCEACYRWRLRHQGADRRVEEIASE